MFIWRSSSLFNSYKEKQTYSVRFFNAISLEDIFFLLANPIRGSLIQNERGRYNCSHQDENFHSSYAIRCIFFFLFLIIDTS